MATVLRASADDWEAVRAVRLRAFGDAAGAFASTLERELSLGEGDWRRRLTGGPWWLAHEEQGPVGMVAGLARPEEPGRAHLLSMWVDPAARGRGLADALVAAVVDWAAGGGLAEVRLWVVDGNVRARRFYERVGFSPTGNRQPLPSDPAVGETEMVRRLAG